MTVKIIEDKALWDEFVDRSPSGMLFHKWDFLRIVEKYAGGRVMNYGIYREGELLAVMPILFKVIGGLRTAYSPPQSSIANLQYLGIVVGQGFDHGGSRDQEANWFYIVGEVDGIVNKRRQNYISIGLTPFFKDMRPFYWSGYDVSVMFTYVVDITAPLERIWEGFDRECKKNINECVKKGFELRPADDVERFCGLMRDGMRDKSTFFHRQNPGYLKDLINAYAGNMEMYYLYEGSEIVSGCLIIKYKDRYVLWMGTIAARGRTSANEFLVWELMKKARAEGYTLFENPGADEKRLNSFKSKFNPSLDLYCSASKQDAAFRLARYASERLSFSKGQT